MTARTAHKFILALVVFSLIAAQALAEGWKLENDIRFSPRQYHGAAVMGDRIFVAAGMRMGMTTTMTNDVWASRDGVKWERLAADPPFSPRQEASLVAFKGKLMLIGGKDEGLRADEEHPWFSDIWTSSDGREWGEIDSSFLPEGAERIFAFADAGRLFIIGEASQSMFVFSSTDGEKFIDLKAKGLPEGDFGYAWNGSLFVFSGYLKRIYTSTNGITWKENPALNSKFMSRPAALGSGSSSTLYAILEDGFRTSKNGISWNAVKDGSTIPGLLKLLEGPETSSYGEYVREGASLLAFEGRLFMIGGSLGSKSSSPGVSVGGFELMNEVWESRDGKTWKLHPGPNYFSSPLPRYGQASAVHKDKLYILGGAEDPANDRLYADTWAYDSGGKWQALGPEVSIYDWTKDSGIWEPRTRAAAASFKGRLWLIGGQASGYGEPDGLRSDIWSSEDGSSWKLEADKTDFGPRAGHVLLTHSGRLWLFGGEGPDPADPEAKITMNDIWSSEDGLSWTKIDPIEPPQFTAYAAAASVGERIWFSGGAFMDKGEGYVTRATWSSADGLSWREESAQDIFFSGGAGTQVGDCFLIFGGFGRGKLIPIVYAIREGEGAGVMGTIPPSRIRGYLGSLAVMGGKLWYYSGLDDIDGQPLGALWSIPISALEF